MFLLAIITDEEREYINSQIAKLKQGDDTAIDKIYRAVGGRMLSVAMGLLRNKQLAEDVLHDSFIKIVRHAKTFRAGTNGYAWLCTIVRNTAINLIKHENIRKSEDIDGFFTIADSSSNLSEERRERAIIVEAAIKRLEPRERTVIWLKYYNDMIVRMIASELQMPK